MGLAEEIARYVDRQAASGSTTGTVTGTSGTRVLVTVAGAAMTLPRLASYSAPAAGDVVFIDRSNPDSWLIIGKIA